MAKWRAMFCWENSVSSCFPEKQLLFLLLLLHIYLPAASASDDSRRLHEAAERFQAEGSLGILALVSGLPGFFPLASLSFQNQGLQVF